MLRPGSLAPHVLFSLNYWELRQYRRAAFAMLMDWIAEDACIETDLAACRLAPGKPDSRLKRRQRWHWSHWPPKATISTSMISG